MDFDRVNDIVRTKTAELKRRLQGSIKSLGMHHVDSRSNYEPLTNIRTNVSLQRGLANRIRIRFKKTGVFVHKGVGRGTKAAQVGETNRKPKEWFNPVVDQFADELAEQMADELVDVVFNSIKIN
ncbi:MAG: hypothetical protein JO301_16960 [Chitinophagaceae bacterium]|nr:hypothetical protein [Chitinophagaceae bacterium]